MTPGQTPDPEIPSLSPDSPGFRNIVASVPSVR
jgi:hypothetical protein